MPLLFGTGFGLPVAGRANLVGVGLFGQGVPPALWLPRLDLSQLVGYLSPDFFRRSSYCRSNLVTKVSRLLLW